MCQHISFFILRVFCFRRDGVLGVLDTSLCCGTVLFSVIWVSSHGGCEYCLNHLVLCLSCCGDLIITGTSSVTVVTVENVPISMAVAYLACSWWQYLSSSSLLCKSALLITFQLYAAVLVTVVFSYRFYCSTRLVASHGGL